jgi:hypothetical protein
LPFQSSGKRLHQPRMRTMRRCNANHSIRRSLKHMSSHIAKFADLRHPIAHPHALHFLSQNSPFHIRLSPARTTMHNPRPSPSPSPTALTVIPPKPGELASFRKTAPRIRRAVPKPSPACTTMHNTSNPRPPSPVPTALTAIPPDPGELALFRKTAPKSAEPSPNPPRRAQQCTTPQARRGPSPAPIALTAISVKPAELALFRKTANWASNHPQRAQ